MSSISDLVNALRKNQEEANKLVAKISSMAVGGSASDSTDTLSPVQKLEKRLEKKEEDLEKLSAKTKSKSPDKDDEKKTKLTEEIDKLKEKIAEAEKPAEKKPRKKAEKKVETVVETADAPEESVEEVVVATIEKKPVKTAPTKKAKEAPKEEKKTVPEKAEAAPEKRIVRMAGPTLTQFKAVFVDEGLTMTDVHKKNFAEYVNGLESDAYAAVGLAVHMKTYATTLKQIVATLTKEELLVQAKGNNLEEVSVGVYRNKKTSQMVTGPVENDDMELEEAPVDGKEYFLDNTTRRVYETVDGKDVFVGYWGVGKFYEADL